MAIKNDKEYIKVNSDKIFEHRGFIPVLVYRSEEDRQKEKDWEKLTWVSTPRPRIVNLKFDWEFTPTTDKLVIENIVSRMYEQLKTEKIRKSVITYVEEKQYGDYLDC